MALSAQLWRWTYQWGAWRNSFVVAAEIFLRRWINYKEFFPFPISLRNLFVVVVVVFQKSRLSFRGAWNCLSNEYFSYGSFSHESEGSKVLKLVNQACCLRKTTSRFLSSFALGVNIFNVWTVECKYSAP